MAPRPHDADEPADHPTSRAPGSAPSSAHPAGPDGALPDGAGPAERGHETAAPEEPAAATEDARDDDSGAADAAPETPSADDPGHRRDQQPTSDAEIDARWAEIVAQLGDLGTGGTPARPLRPTPPPEAGARADDTAPPPEPRQPAHPPPGPRPEGVPGAVTPPGAPRAWTPAEDPEEDHFLPPDPGPVLGGDPLLTMAWVVVAVVPVLLILAAVLWRSAPSIVIQVAGAVFVAAVGVLVWRMPRSRDDDTSGPGAVV